MPKYHVLSPVKISGEIHRDGVIHLDSGAAEPLLQSGSLAEVAGSAEAEHQRLAAEEAERQRLAAEEAERKKTEKDQKAKDKATS